MRLGRSPTGSVVTEPVDGWTRPAMPFSIVDFPDPFGPMMAVMLPSGIAADDGATAVLDP